MDYIDTLLQQAEVAEMFVNEIGEESKEGMEIMAAEELSYNSSNLSIEYFFSTLFVGATMLLAYFQFKIVRSHLVSRKYIWCRPINII